MAKTLSQKLADYALSLKFEDLSTDVIREVKRRVIDSFGCALGAYDSAPGSGARRLAGRTTSSIGSGGATVIGLTTSTPPDLAAFANGILFRYLDYNDTYLSKEPAHPSDNIPAALAVAETEGANGKALITAIALGYEIQSRLCDAASLRANGWDHVTYVSAGTSLLSAKLMGLDGDKTANALSLGITPNNPLRQTRVGELSMWKGCAAGNAARNGVFGALMAREGITGPPEVFEGEMGLMNQATGKFELDIDGFGKAGKNFKILDTYIKYFPCEYHSQAGVEAALELREGLNIDDITEINIESYDACVDIIAGDESKWSPNTRETADHSLPYIVAASLVDGTIGLEQFATERIQDSALRTLIRKIKVERNHEHNAAYPASFPCFIEIKTKNNETRSITVDYPKGHPKNALTDTEVEGKLKKFGPPLIGNERVEKILETVWGLQDMEDITELMKLFAIEPRH